MNKATNKVSHRISHRVLRSLRWLLAALACLWLALCTAVGPIYRADRSIASFSWINALIGTAAFVAYFGLVCLLVRWGRGRTVRIETVHTAAAENDIPRVVSNGDNHCGQDDHCGQRGQVWGLTHGPLARICQCIIRPARRFLARHEQAIIHATDRGWKIMLILIAGWAWCYLTLLAAFGADLFSQIREFTSFWEQSHGDPQIYLNGTGVVNTIMDVYPTAHYLWPADPTFLTNQHNIVLTLLYGSVAYASRSITGAVDAGIVLLSGAQFVFAAFCCAATANRFLNLPFLRGSAEFASSSHCSSNPTSSGRLTPSGSVARVVVLALLLLNPIVVFSTISLTKSPLFAFAFVWWFGVLYELYATPFRTSLPHTAIPPTVIPRAIIPLALSTLVMLASAKYALYVVALQIVLALLADRKRWRIWLVAMVIPLIVFQGALTALTATDTIIGGDPIESKGLQLQQIGRVARNRPESIPDSARREIAPIIDLDAAAKAYFPQDADRMKSSGSAEDKPIVYRWRTVTADDMTRFTKAWIEIGRAAPVDYIDGALAKMYGYFDVTDGAYVSMTYYIDNGVMERSTPGIKHWLGGWRDAVAAFANGWAGIPVLGWPTHGNFWVVLTLVVGAAEVVLRRWRSLAFHLPMLLLMGVMMTAPANNFERHMLPLAFAFAFLALWFRRDSISGDSASTDSPSVDSPQSGICRDQFLPKIDHQYAQHN
ncbi:hypothetical protein Uis1B_0041 [Bifidobacterium margollesii]|uniref:Beta-carotene 15,15'-monooxygenase n=1 Tax=Bifidobacterium margollesii TaxID=2020964 RepID=A0A2N5JCM7_9BIFI|nr:DUF6020 family protein [Bifidobacterium margollesii]PLS31951.1 hypothetical protein Uis1B_0041 [Bifidobacterium margollesii]